MRIVITKHADGSHVMRCERGDGTFVWQRQPPHLARFFALHDLTHFAIESTLNLREGFYGLLASGWQFTDFGKPWPRGPLPVEALIAEFLVGCFDQERATGAKWSAAPLNKSGKTYVATGAWRILNDAQLDQIRETFDDLSSSWIELPAGESLELIFTAANV